MREYFHKKQQQIHLVYRLHQSIVQRHTKTIYYVLTISHTYKTEIVSKIFCITL